jgi:hypothetical protein
MTMLLLTVAGLVIAGLLSGAFPALGDAMHRRQRGLSMLERRSGPWHPAPPSRSRRQRH